MFLVRQFSCAGETKHGLVPSWNDACEEQQLAALTYALPELDFLNFIVGQRGSPCKIENGDLFDEVREPRDTVHYHHLGTKGSRLLAEFIVSELWNDMVLIPHNGQQSEDLEWLEGRSVCLHSRMDESCSMLVNTTQRVCSLRHAFVSNDWIYNA